MYPIRAFTHDLSAQRPPFAARAPSPPCIPGRGHGANLDTPVVGFSILCGGIHSSARTRSSNFWTPIHGGLGALEIRSPVFALRTVDVMLTTVFCLQPQAFDGRSGTPSPGSVRTPCWRPFRGMLGKLGDEARRRELAGRRPAGAVR